MSRKHDGKSSSREEQILAAAEDLLAETGYEGVSARAITERAGVNKALLFYYFGDMAGIFERILERYYQRHREALSGAFSSAGSLDERMHRVVDAYLDFIESNRLYPRLVQQQVSGGGEYLEQIRGHLASFFSWTVEALSEVAPAEGPLSAKHFFLSLSGIVVNYFTYAPTLGDELWGRDPLSAEALAERRQHVHWLVDRLLAGLEDQAARRDRC